MHSGTEPPHTHTAAVPASDLARFEVSESEREYRGDPDDRKALLEHRQVLQSRARELDAARRAFVKQFQERHAREARAMDSRPKVRKCIWRGG